MDTSATEGLPDRVLAAAVIGEAQAVAAWLDAGGGVNSRCAERGDRTLLIAAANGGQEAIVRMLLQRGASVNLQRSNGGTALMNAAVGGHTTVVQALLDAKADASLQHSGGSTALMWAEQYKQTETAQLLRQHTKQQPAGAEAGAAASMVHAAAAADAMATELLVEETAGKEEAAAKKRKGKKKKGKAAPTSTDVAESAATVPLASMPRPAAAEEGLPAGVSDAAYDGNAHAVTAWLDESGGVDARCAEHEDDTLLMAAAIGGQEAMVRMLLQRGASVNLQNSLGDTALMDAAANGHTTVVQVLLDAKADASLQSIDGLTALMYAEQEKRTATAQLLRQHAKRQMAEAEAKAAAAAAGLLAEEAAEKEAATKKGKGKKQKAKAATSTAVAEPVAAAPSASTPRPAAAEKGLPANVSDSSNEGDARAVAAWLDEGGGVDARCAERNDAALLMDAACGGQEAMVRVLLQRGASVNLQDSNGGTALMAAAAYGHPTIVQALLEAKADASLQAVHGHTALMMAEQMKHAATTQLLRQHAKLQAAEAEAKAAAAAAGLLAEEAAEKEAATKKGKGKKQKAKPAPKKIFKATTTGADCSAESPPAVPELPSQAASGPQKEARAAAAAQKAVLVDVAAVERAQAEATAAERIAVLGWAAEEERASRGEGIARSVAPVAFASLPARAAIALTLAELTTATGGFGEQRLIGSGGYGSVFIADALPSLPPEVLPPQLRHLPLVVKRANTGAQRDLADLQREVNVLQQCDHPHLLPLFGYCLELESPCLVFPLMRHGNFADRMWLSKADPEHQLRRLGLSAPLKPLQWRERLNVLHQATEALLYLHTISVIHRDFKPENILLDDDRNAFLADTGFAKMEHTGPALSKMKSASNALYLTMGYLDPSIVAGRQYSTATDGWALGITILVTLTGRSPLNIFESCEDDFEDDFEAIDAGKLADAEAGWPTHVATAIKEVVRAAQKGLCHNSNRKRLAVANALATLQRLANEGESSVLVESPAISSDSGAHSKVPSSSAQPYEPTPLSMQVRETRKGGGVQKGIQDNMLLAFSNLMPRVDAIYAASAAVAPESFEERINFWHRECGMRSEVKGCLHRLRVWANAARHHDAERWMRDGPRSEAEASQLVAAVQTAIKALEC